MKQGVLTVLFILAAALVITVVPVAAVGSPPSVISGPDNFGVANYGGSAAYCTMSAQDDLRALLGQTLEERGYQMYTYAQVDFKTDNGDWHYKADWDDPAAYRKYSLNLNNTMNGGEWGRYIGSDYLTFKNMFPEEKNVPVPSAYSSWEWFKSHSMTFRARFAIDFGKNNIVFSDWSQEYVLSGKSLMDYKKIMNTYAPELISAKLQEDAKTKKPFVWLETKRQPDETQKLNAASSGNMTTEVWMRKNGDKDFKLVGDVFFANEKIYLDVSAYYKDNIKDYAAAAYEVKVRYKIDERKYQQSEATAQNLLYSPFSNVISYGMPAWSEASPWAGNELGKADEYDLIPDILKGADMTKPITREEFASLAVVLYEKTTDKKASPASPNPFTDTNNPEILKAFQLGITKGTSATTFSPMDLITREQCAAMLARAVRTMVPGGDFSTDGAPVFTDQADISSWALEDVKFMSKIGVIKGSNGKFMPKATTAAEKAAGYATSTREQAIIMSKRIYENYNK